jgi:hypothetical protein
VARPWLFLTSGFPLAPAFRLTHRNAVVKNLTFDFRFKFDQKKVRCSQKVTISEKFSAKKTQEAGCRTIVRAKFYFTKGKRVKVSNGYIDQFLKTTYRARVSPWHGEDIPGHLHQFFPGWKGLR